MKLWKGIGHRHAVALVSLALATAGCGGGSHSSNGSAPLTGGPTGPSSPTAPSTPDTPNDPTLPGQPHAVVLGTVTQVDGSTANLSGQTLVAIGPTGATLGQATSDAQGHFELHVQPEVEVEIEIEPNAPAAHRIHVGTLHAGDAAGVRCHVAGGHIDDFAMASSDQRTHAHLSASGIEVEIEAHRSSGVTSATIDATGATANTALHLVDASTGAEVARMSVAADGTAHLQLENELEGQLELHDDAGNLLGSKLVPSLPRDEAELESRSRGLGSFTMTVGTGSIEASNDDDGDELEVEVHHAAASSTIVVKLETAPGTLSPVGSITTDQNGRGRLKLSGSSLPARMSALVGRHLELDDQSSSVIATGSMPALAPDF